MNHDANRKGKKKNQFFESKQMDEFTLLAFLFRNSSLR